MKYLYITVGCIALGVGAVGVVLPVLPTTPFLLLASICFAKGSKRFHDWFLSTKLYKKHLEGFVKERAMKLQAKLSLLAFASSTLLLAMLFMPSNYGRTFLLGLMLFKYYYFIFRVRTIRQEQKNTVKEIGEAA